LAIIDALESLAGFTRIAALHANRFKQLAENFKYIKII